MLTINICYTGFIVSMPIAQSKRKLIAATALFIAVGSLTGAIATGGPLAFAQTQGQGGGGATTEQQGGQQGGQQGRITQQGTVTSVPFPLPGEAFEGDQGAQILELMQDNVYSGVLTYTASQAVNLVILNVQQDLNQTEQAILNDTEDGDDDGFGTLITSQLDNQTSIALTIIPAGTSGSIPFTGNGVWLHTDGTPFAASYAVSAQTLQPEIVNEISNATLTAAADDDDADDDDADGGAGNATDTDE
jgi:hypothetical protein